jgi:menaquinol-cytochrome c reductase iron-sulfur subunit
VCPCHGGTFSADGTHLSGPPRRSLDSLDTKVAGGKLMVKYQYFRPDVSVKEVTS